MGDLGNHFGEDASLAPDIQADILAYLSANSADAPGARQFRALLRGVAAQDVPLRITEMPWWKRAHREVNPKRFTKPEIKSASNCVACHEAAGKGIFTED